MYVRKHQHSPKPQSSWTFSAHASHVDQWRCCLPWPSYSGRWSLWWRRQSICSGRWWSNPSWSSTRPSLHLGLCLYPTGSTGNNLAHTASLFQTSWDQLSFYVLFHCFKKKERLVHWQQQSSNLSPWCSSAPPSSLLTWWSFWRSSGYVNSEGKI